MTTERRTLEIAEALYNKVKGETPSFFDSSRWKGRIMDWAMKDERFKVQLFRFVDAIPSLKTEAELLQLLDEYFYGESPLLPERLKKWIPHSGIPALIAGKLIKANVTSLARQFIAGATPGEALGELKKLRREGRAFTVDLLGEAVLSDPEAKTFEGRYLELVDALKELIITRDFEVDPVLDRDAQGPIPRGDISLKVSSFYSRLDPISIEDSIENIKAPLKRIMEKAGSGSPLSVTFDMEHYALKDLTFEIFKGVLSELPEFTHPGIAVQSYLRESDDDLRGLIDWARRQKRRIVVRLVKGAYLDYERVVNTQEGWPVPVFQKKTETDRCFERLTRLLLESTDVVRPAIASHNIRSIAHAMAVAEELGLKKNAIEFQALYGMAEPIKKATTAMGFRVRDYVPAGEFLPGMAYLVRRLLENTSNESFLRLSFVERLDFDELARAPQKVSEEKVSEEEGPKKNMKIEAAGADGRAGLTEAFTNTPLTDFSRKEQRDSFVRFTKKASEDSKKPEGVPLIIGGKEVFTDNTFASLDPARPERVVAEVSTAAADDSDLYIGRAVESATEAQKDWSRATTNDRAGVLLKAATWFKQRRHELAALQILEVGKSWREADSDVAEAIDFLNFYAREMMRIGAPKRLGSMPGELNYSHYIPRGVTAVIAPWNFPLAIATGMTSAAIVTGNAVVLKPSTLAPLTAYYIVKAFKEAGLPDGVLNFLPGPGRVVGGTLAAHPDVAAIAFTGSMEVGLSLVKTAAEVGPEQANVKHVIAEMGGKNAVIVDASADIDEAVKGVLASFTGFQGQKCSAASRVIIVGKGDKAKEFTKRLSEACASLKMGSPVDPANTLGPVIDPGALKKIKEYIEIGKGEAELAYSYEVPPELEATGGYYVGPHIFSGVTPEMRIATEEIFGPVLAIMEAPDIDEAIEIANSTRFALTGGIYSRSPVNIEKVREGLSVGNVYINRKITGALVERQPFGGFKMSGLGSKAGGVEYLQHFMLPRVVSENTLRRGFAPEE